MPMMVQPTHTPRAPSHAVCPASLPLARDGCLLPDGLVTHRALPAALPAPAEHAAAQGQAARAHALILAVVVI